MGYLVCDKCGGYYELETGESLDDFERCQCGGNLTFFNNVSKNKSDNNYSSSFGKSPIFICPHCLEKYNSGIFCSKCGSDLISVKNDNGFLNRENYSQNNSLELKTDYGLNKRVPKKYPKKRYHAEYYSEEDKNYHAEPNSMENILNKINWVAVIIGSVFFVIASFLLIIMAVLLAVTQSDFSSMYYNPNFQLIWVLGLFLLALVVVAVFSGALAGYISKSKHYGDGALNGFVAGLVAIALMIGSGGSGWFSLIILVVYGGLATAGGALGVFIRKKSAK